MLIILVQLDSRGEHLENISQLQLYEYQLDESLCPTATRDSFSYHTNESPDYTNDRSSCFYDEDTMSTVSMANEGSKDSLQSDSSWRSKGSKDISGNTYHHTTKTEEGSELGKAAAGVVVKRQVGLLAQEVQRVLPNAVRVTVSGVCVYMCVCVCVCVCVYV